MPRPIRLGRASVAWIESEINEYIENQIAHGRVKLTQKARVWKRKASTACAA
jgi:hypothetical protein